MWRELGPDRGHSLTEGGTGPREEESGQVAELHFTLERRRAGGRKDLEPAAPDIQSARAPCHDPLGNLVGPGPTPLLSMALHCPWLLPAARTQTQSQTCTLLTSVPSVGGGGWQACWRRAVCQASIRHQHRGASAASSRPTAPRSGKEKACKMITGPPSKASGWAGQASRLPGESGH